MIDLIVFDLDGTLVDSHRDLAKAANTLVHELGGAPLAVDAVVRMVGEGAAVLVRRALIASGLDPATPGALARFLAIYDGCLLDETVPYPGTLDLLRALEGRYRLAVLTNKPARATARIVEASVSRRSSIRLSEGTPRLAASPTPPGSCTSSQAGTTPECTTLVGDSPADLGAARNAGTAICLARFGFGYTFGAMDLDGTEHIIDAPGELLGVVDRL